MSERDAGIAAVVLAAGASTRLGEPKQLIRIEGESLLRRTARLAGDAGCMPVFVVLGCEAERMRNEMEGLATTPVIHEGWSEGMGSSLRRGIEAVCATQPQPAAVLLLVCDQAKLTVEHLRRLMALQESEGAGVIASGYAGRAGVPAIFGEEFYGELLELQGDAGAREVIRRHPEALKTVFWAEGEMDVDLPEDLARLRV